MKTLELLRKHRKEIYEIAEKYGVSNIRVFGSVARGEEKKGSDVDLLVTTDKQTSLMSLVKLEKILEIKAGKKFQVISDKAVNRHIRDQVFSEIVSL